jgi:hypothetical protein
MTRNHHCKSMDHGETWLEERDDGCYLNINHLATEQDLEENHYLEEVGQTMNTVALLVLYCPYCRVNLDGSRDAIVPSFTFHDLSS